MEEPSLTISPPKPETTGQIPSYGLAACCWDYWVSAVRCFSENAEKAGDPCERAETDRPQKAKTEAGDPCERASMDWPKNAKTRVWDSCEWPSMVWPQEEKKEE